MTTKPDAALGKAMETRQSVRNFDPDVRIPHAEVTEMIQEAISAPSACNLQSWYFAVVDTPAGKEQLRSFFLPFNRPQLDTASTIVMIFGNTKSHEAYRDLWQKAYENGQVTAEKRDEILKTFLPFYESATQDFLKNDATVDASLAAMQLMLAAQLHGYVTNPIGGYDPSKAAIAMGLDPKQYVPVMAVAIGKPAPAGNLGENLAVKSIRYAPEQVMKFITD
ncbi:nitroreductase family protein [Lactiplantibacillus garii]|uniref:Nitroreductase family protein n=1 Tax=Lactiplantibacillus garii TaxID=2306423 RepID=A0A426D6K6_9LACO|nr:nitroreductase family protein [Lactiplantibacillus garii]RRK10218.1 nitroreductase family protein [Lactiplantibacillus garii]